VRQSIRGYTDGVIDQSASGLVSTTAAELSAVRALVEGSDDLRLTLSDPGVPEAARLGVVIDLLGNRVGEPTLRLLTFVIRSDGATQFMANLGWLEARVGAATRGGTDIGETVLGRTAAIERIDGYATAVLERVTGERELGNIEDELFRFMRVVDGSDDLRAALTDRSVPVDARHGIVVDLLQARATGASLSLAAYATHVGRPRDYVDLLAHIVDRVAGESNRRLAEVLAPVDLDDEQRRQLATALTRVVGRQVEVRVTVDPSVLGGFVATIGDTVVDGSARHRLELLKERLAMPEVHTTTGDQT
jgi:F-type H+-transporting ATPase subunit delta